MKGTVFFEKHRKAWAIGWYISDLKRSVKIRYYRGEPFYVSKQAQKALSIIQGEVEAGTFRIEKWTGKGWTDVIEFFEAWLKTKERNKPATIKGYKSYYKNWIKPFFKKHPVMLQEIRLDTLYALLDSINLSPKGKYNVMNCMHAFLVHAWRSERIDKVPPFPNKTDYELVDPTFKWLPEDRQIAIISAIAKDDRPIFWWLKYHLRRPSEACALMGEDYDRINDLFVIRRAVSSRQVVSSTKTRAEHIVPCHRLFQPYLQQCSLEPGSYVFQNKRARRKGRRYTNESLNVLWKAACRATGEDISLYAGLKHSSCTQYVNEKGLSISDLKEITDHARMESVRRYAKVGLARKRELMEATQKRPNFKVVDGNKT